MNLPPGCSQAEIDRRFGPPRRRPESDQYELDLAELKRTWIEYAEKHFHVIKHHLGNFTSDDLRDFLPAPDEPNWLGCLVAKLRCLGEIHEVGRVVSSRREANGRKVTVWRCR